MNLKAVLRTYSLLLQLTDDESALLATLRGMSDSERELLVESLQPEKVATKKSAVTTRKGGCAACDYTKPSPIHHKTTMTGYHVYQPAKSQRASNMAATLGKNLAQQRKVTTGDLCQRVFAGSVCNLPEEDSLHEKGSNYLDAHPFASFSSARPAAEGSSTNGDEASSEIGSEDVSVAVDAGG